MSTERVKECTLSDDELIAAAHKAITDMCQRQRWQMTVPVDFNKDSDMILSELINRFEKLRQSPSSIEEKKVNQ